MFHRHFSVFFLYFLCRLKTCFVMTMYFLEWCLAMALLLFPFRLFWLFPVFSYSNKTVFSSLQFSSVRSLSHVRLFATPWIAACQACLSITNSQSSLRLMSIESVMPSSHLILCHPLLLLHPIPPSIRVFQWVNSSHEVAKVLESQLQHHSFQRNPRAALLQNGLVGSPCSPRDSQESSPTPQVFNTQ